MPDGKLRMAFRLLGIVTVLALLVVNPSGASAKQPSFILTGGELGEYAAHVSSPLPQGPYLVFGAPVSQLALTQAPSSEPSPRYAIYDAGPYAAWKGPSHYYYPTTRLLHSLDLDKDRWYDVLPEWAAFMDSAIEEALAQKGRGELELGPIAAGLRQSWIPRGTLWLRPNAGGEGSSYSASSVSRCAGCAFLGPAEEFVMRDLAAMLSKGPTTDHSPRGPAYAIEFFASYGRGGVGGLVGFYAPPEDGESGRFWPPGYNYDTETPYFEATAGFDAVIASALSGPQTNPQSSELESQVQAARPDRGVPRSTMFGAIAAGALAVLVGISVRTLVRRRG